MIVKVNKRMDQFKNDEIVKIMQFAVNSLIHKFILLYLHTNKAIHYVYISDPVTYFYINYYS